MTITITMPSMKLAREAVTTLLAHMRRALARSTLSQSPSQAINMAITEARAPTTTPWTWIKARLADPITTVCSKVSKSPKLACVDNLKEETDMMLGVFFCI